jgi:predicted metal-dependent peptidase
MLHAPFEDRYEFVQSLLQRRHAYIAAGVMRLGKVHFTDTVDTAAICASGSDVRLYFNPEFSKKIDNWELAGVLVHEALHFVFRHLERMARTRTQQERFLFGLACDAVINDLIITRFDEIKLPGQPVTGRWLIGRDASNLSAEKVFRMIRRRIAGNPDELHRLTTGLTVDDHTPWHHDEPSAEDQQTGWSSETTAIVERLLTDAKSRDRCYGTVARGRDRLVSQTQSCKTNLARFLLDSVQAESSYDSIWTQPNRKLISVYPSIILPSYQPMEFWDVLVGIDTSGSVPNSFISIALNFAEQRIPKTRISVISFDTAWYQAVPGAVALKGGGGTRAQAIEEYIRDKLPRYPDCVFVLTDGWTPRPEPLHPERWVWLLPPWGSIEAIPKGSRSEYFDASDVRR